MALFGTPSTPAGQATGFAFGSSFTTPQTPATGLFGGSASSGGGLFGSSTPAFGSSTPTPAFGSPAPAFGSSTPTPAFGSSTPAFGSSTPAFGSSTPAFGSSTPAFGSPTPAFGSSTPAFGGSTPAFGTASTSAFGANPFASSTPGFGSSTPGFGSSPAPAFGTSAPAFGAPSATPSFGFGAPTPAFGFSSFAPTPSIFGSSGSSPAFGTTPGFGFGQSQPAFGQPPSGYGQFNAGQLTTQMAPVAPLVVPLPEREVQAIAEAYKEDPVNSRYAFKHLLLSVMEPSERVKPPNVSDIMWAEAMSKLEAMDMEERERLYPQLMLGFKDLSKRLQLQDEALTSDVRRLEATEANVKLLQRHFQVDTTPWIQRLRLKEQQLQRKMLKLMRIIEAMEAKGLRMPLTKAETHIGEKLRGLLRQLQPSSGELPRRAESVLSVSRLQAGVGGSPLAGQLHEQSLVEIQEVLRKQTEAISRLAAVLKRDLRDIEIMTDDGSHFLGMDIAGATAAAAARSNDVFAMPAA